MEKNEEKTSNQVSSAGENAGRGFLVISVAKAWFMVGGVTITFGLPLIFSWFAEDGRALFGKYYDINNTLSILAWFSLADSCLQYLDLRQHIKNRQHIFSSSLVEPHLCWQSY